MSCPDCPNRKSPPPKRGVRGRTGVDVVELARADRGCGHVLPGLGHRVADEVFRARQHALAQVLPLHPAREGDAQRGDEVGILSVRLMCPMGLSASHGEIRSGAALPSSCLPRRVGTLLRVPADAGLRPHPVPVACSPQAWSAGVAFQLLAGILGLPASAEQNQLALERPRLPGWLASVELENLRLGRSRLTFRAVRGHGGTAVELLAREGDAELVVRPW
jgi:hypothetical protein